MPITLTHICGIQRLRLPAPARDAIEIAGEGGERSLLLFRDFTGNVYARVAGGRASWSELFARITPREANEIYAAMRYGSAYCLAGLGTRLAYAYGRAATGNVFIDRATDQIDGDAEPIRLANTHGQTPEALMRHFMRQPRQSETPVETLHLQGIATDRNQSLLLFPDTSERAVWLSTGGHLWSRLPTHEMLHALREAMRGRGDFIGWQAVNLYMRRTDTGRFGSGDIISMFFADAPQHPAMIGEAEAARLEAALSRWHAGISQPEEPEAVQHPPRATENMPPHEVGAVYDSAQGERRFTLIRSRRVVLAACQSGLLRRNMWVALSFTLDSMRIHLRTESGVWNPTLPIELLGDGADQILAALRDRRQLQQAGSGLRLQATQNHRVRVSLEAHPARGAYLSEQQAAAMFQAIAEEQQSLLRRRLPEPADCATLAPEDT